MRLRNIPGADEAILNSEYCIKEPESKKGNWQSVFSSTQPLHIEIGMGKGRFIMDMAACIFFKVYTDTSKDVLINQEITY